MSQDFKVISFQLLPNIDVELHSKQQLQNLVKKKVISKNLLQYNEKLAKYLSQYSHREQDQDYKAKQKKLLKQIGKIDQLNEQDKIAILNNKFANESELILKIQNCENISSKERKIILDHQF